MNQNWKSESKLFQSLIFEFRFIVSLHTEIKGFKKSQVEKFKYYCYESFVFGVMKWISRKMFTKVKILATKIFKSKTS